MISNKVVTEKKVKEFGTPQWILLGDNIDERTIKFYKLFFL